MKPYDAIILGAGIAGLSVARELAKRGLHVLVLERSDPGGKASRAAAGILDPYTEAREETPLLALGLEALQFYPSFLDELGKEALEEVEYKKSGLLYLAFSDEDQDLLKTRFEWQKRRGLPVESLSAAQVRKIEPEISKRTQGGILFPEIPKLNAGKLTTLLFRRCEAAGVEIRRPVKEASVAFKGEQVRGVEGSEGFIEARAVVLAAGCWASQDPRLGIPLKVSPVRGQILILRCPAPLYPGRILHTVRYAYIVPWPGNRLLIGSTLESAGFDERVTPEAQKDILDRASEMIEALREFPIETSWAGLRPYAEGGPVIGPAHFSGLFLATGYYRSGILIGPLVGKLLADAILSGKFSPLLEPFFPK